MSQSRYYFAENQEYDQQALKEAEDDLAQSIKNLKIEPILEKTESLEPNIRPIAQFQSPQSLEAERMIINLQFLKSQIPDYINNITSRIEKSIEHYQSVLEKNKK